MQTITLETNERYKHLEKEFIENSDMPRNMKMVEITQFNFFQHRDAVK